MKISILGGAGRVGASAAFALQMAGLGREILLVDVAKDVAEGEALDLRHGASLAYGQVIRAADISEAADADIVIHCAGLRRRPDESRLDLINRNVELWKNLAAQLNQGGWRKDAILLVVANPVDILTYLTTQLCPLPKSRIIGLGTVVDSTRFRSFIGEHFGIDQTQVDALILGEHGDSMAPIWSSATINGVPVASLPGFTPELADELFKKTKTSGADVIRLKGGAGYCVGLSIARLVQAIVRDEHALLPVSTYQQGALGIDTVCLSLPTIVGRNGVLQVIEPVVNDKEKTALQESAAILKKTISSIGG